MIALTVTLSEVHVRLAIYLEQVDPEVKKRLNSVAAIAPPSSEEEGEHITAVWIRIQDHSCEEKQELKQKHIAYYGTNTLHCQEEL